MMTGKSKILLFSTLQCFTILLVSSPYCHGFVSGNTYKSIIRERSVITQQFQSSENDVTNSMGGGENSSPSPHLRAIEEALAATRKYGATSKEARVAWEIAEEIEDSIFSPCSKRCDPLTRSASIGNKSTKKDLSPLFVDKSDMNSKEETESTKDSL
mmetsp:Transcript_34655/g.84039  ORF Transcript_34655/g.84039 Transcript_34655/m.84039 type:complete len:157 (-) Transcript_34655:4414-4884(-)